MQFFRTSLPSQTHWYIRHRAGRSLSDFALCAARWTSMTDLGKLLVVVGIVLVVAGAALMLLGRTNLPLGRLPGDIIYRGKNTTFYFPLATSLLVSVVLSVVLYVLTRWKR